MHPDQGLGIVLNLFNLLWYDKKLNKQHGT